MCSLNYDSFTSCRRSRSLICRECKVPVSVEINTCVLFIMIVLNLVGVVDHYFVGNKKGPISVQICAWMKRNTIIKRFGMVY